MALTRSKRLLAALLALMTGASTVAPAFAQGRPLPLIRDTEIENLLRDYTRPIFNAAKVNSSAVQIILVNDRSFNAFVANGRRIFINVGALIDSQTPNQIIGVLAHETGHIAGGHLQRLREQLERAQTLMIVGMLMGVGAMAGAAASGSRSAGEALPGVMTGPSELARRSVLSYQRGEEAAADRAAVDYLNATGQSARGMIETFKRFQDQALFSARRADPYQQSHPMPLDRIANLESVAQKSPHFNKKDAPALQARHDLMRAKLIAFVDGPDSVMRRYPPNDNGLPARYARAISTFRFGDRMVASRLTDDLIRAQPGNPYFYELKGQIHLETGQPQLAVAPLRKSVSMSPNSGLIRMMLGHALVASGGRAQADEAIRELRIALQREPEIGSGYRYLAMAYAAKDDGPQADLASAQAAFYEGDLQSARSMARRAQRGLPTNSPGWLKAEDIASFKPPAAR